VWVIQRVFFALTPILIWQTDRPTSTSTAPHVTLTDRQTNFYFNCPLCDPPTNTHTNVTPGLEKSNNPACRWGLKSNDPTCRWGLKFHTGLNRQTGRPNRILLTEGSIKRPFLSLDHQRLTCPQWHVCFLKSVNWQTWQNDVNSESNGQCCHCCSWNCNIQCQIVFSECRQNELQLSGGCFHKEQQCQNWLLAGNGPIIAETWHVLIVWFILQILSVEQIEWLWQNGPLIVQIQFWNILQRSGCPEIASQNSWNSVHGLQCPNLPTIGYAQSILTRDSRGRDSFTKDMLLSASD